MLKKLATISLLVLFLFNLFGYRLVFDALQQKADQQLVIKLDKKEYNQQQLLTITIPLSMPYLSSSSQFERVDGEITWKGKIFHYVERKVDNGQLVLRCLPDEKKTDLESAKNDIAKASSDASTNTEKKPTATFKQVISDYDDALFQLTINSNSIASVSLHPDYSYSLSQGVYPAPYHPPCI